jgi:hypothetical protein
MRKISHSPMKSQIDSKNETEQQKSGMK